MVVVHRKRLEEKLGDRWREVAGEHVAQESGTFVYLRVGNPWFASPAFPRTERVRAVTLPPVDAAELDRRLAICRDCPEQAAIVSRDGRFPTRSVKCRACQTCSPGPGLRHVAHGCPKNKF